MPATPQSEVTLAPAIGGLDSLMDGGAVSFVADEWDWVEWTLTEPLHMTGANISWEGWKAGDYGYAAIANPAAMHVLDVQANSGQADVDMGTGMEALAAAYNPVNVGAPVWVEFWLGDGVAPPSTARVKANGLIERREVDSVSGTVVTLKENLSDTHLATDTCIMIPLVGLFSTPRGSKNLEGGVYLVGSANDILGSIDRHEATEELAAGLCVCLRVSATSEAATRTFAATFQMRRPSS